MVSSHGSRTDSPGLESDRSSRMNVFPINDTPKRSQLKRSDKKFACPFAKYDPERWGQIESCGTWSNRHIGTVIRHHILEKHNELNARFGSTDPRSIDPSNFTKLQQWKSTVRLVHRKAEDLWTNAYVILFSICEPEHASLPSPYFSNKLSRGLADGNNLQCLSNVSQSTAAPDVYKALQHIETLRAKREMEKSEIYDHFTLELRKLEDKRDKELRQLEERYLEDLDSLQLSPTTTNCETEGITPEIDCWTFANVALLGQSACSLTRHETPKIMKDDAVANAQQSMADFYDCLPLPSWDCIPSSEFNDSNFWFSDPLVDDHRSKAEQQQTSLHTFSPILPQSKPGGVYCGSDGESIHPRNVPTQADHSLSTELAASTTSATDSLGQSGITNYDIFAPQPFFDPENAENLFKIEIKMDHD